MSVTPFRIAVPEPVLERIWHKLADTRIGYAPDDDEGWRYGMDARYLAELVDYWRTRYDWRAEEARLNARPQFMAEVDGIPIHFYHIRGDEVRRPLPILLTHGWPGSVVEFLRVIGPLTDPVRHGGAAGDAFDLVIPSVPGFGFSGPLADTGWVSKRVARAWAELMRRLGYQRYGAQGGDLGAWVSPDLGRVDPEHVAGVHVNAATVGFIPLGPTTDEDLVALSDVEKQRLAEIEHFRTEEWGYNLLQSTRPETLAYALGDSPVGQLAWIAEKFRSWTGAEAVDRDHLLTNVMLYWLTGTAGTAADFYYEAAHSGWEFPAPSGVPTGVATFGRDVSIRRFAERSNVITQWTDYDEGGHFAAMEAPGLLVEDIRTFFRPLR